MVYSVFAKIGIKPNRLTIMSNQAVVRIMVSGSRPNTFFLAFIEYKIKIPSKT